MSILRGVCNDMKKEPAGKTSNGSVQTGTTKAALGIFSSSYKIFVVVLIVVLIVGITYAMYLVDGDWKRTLLGLVFGPAFFSLFIIGGIRCGKNILSEKEEKDLINLRNLKIIRTMSNPLPDIFLRYIVIAANILRWFFFAISLFGAVYLFILHGVTSAFFLFCFFSILWLPALDNLFLKKMNYVIISSIKFAITMCVFLMFAMLNL